MATRNDSSNGVDTTKKFDKMAKDIRKNCAEYSVKCQALLDSLKSKDPNAIAIKYREFLSFVHDSAVEIRKGITNMPIFSDDSIEIFEARLNETECDRSRQELLYRNLLKPYKRWHVITDYENVPRKFRKRVEPWTGYSDERSAPMFLEQFTNTLGWYHDDKTGIRLFLNLLEGDDVERFIETADRRGKLEQVAKKFYKKFANENVFCYEIVSFTEAEYPMFPGEEVFHFVKFWLDRFQHNPKVTMKWVTGMLVNKIPDPYSSSLEAMLIRNEPLSLYTIYEKLRRFESFEEYMAQLEISSDSSSEELVTVAW